MPLILAIEPHKSQAQQLATLVTKRLKAEIVTGASADQALKTLGDRIPDLVLTPALLTSKDEAALTERLRSLGPAASHVQTLAVPILSTAPARRTRTSMLGLGRDRLDSTDTVGCDPDVFADQIKIYLERAAAERAAQTNERAAQPHSAATELVATEAPAPVTEARGDDTEIPEIIDDLWMPDNFDDPAPPAPNVTPEVVAIEAEPVPVLEARAVPEPPTPPRPPRPETRAMELELGLISSTAPTAPPLWRVAEGFEGVEAALIEESSAVNVDAAVPAPDDPPIVEAAVLPPAPVVSLPIVTPPKKVRAAKTVPPLDDWGYFDASQSSFKALIRRLDEIAGQTAVATQ